MRIDVLNGVNLDMLGRRDPGRYGEGSLQDLETQIYAWARDLDLQVRCRQTDHEGEFVGFLHQALGAVDGLVVNPGAWTHYSLALWDACAQLSAPLVEVHISDPKQRPEEFRHTSVVEPHAVLTIAGEGIDGYRHALRVLAEA